MQIIPPPPALQALVVVITMVVELAPCPRKARWPTVLTGKLMPLERVKVPAPSTTTPPAGCAVLQAARAFVMVASVPEYGEIVAQTGQLVSGSVDPGSPACDQSIARLESIIPDQSCARATAGSNKSILRKDRRHRLVFILAELSAAASDKTPRMLDPSPQTVN